MSRIHASWERLAASHSYGVVLVLIIVTFIWVIALPDAGWARVVLVVLQSSILLAALWTSGAPVRARRSALVGCSIAVLVSLPMLASDGSAAQAIAGVMLIAVIAVTPVAIFHSSRSFTRITARTITGALCIYLLVGMFFAAVYAVIDAVTGAPFFSQVSSADYSDYLYYSYVTQTTVGFGDLTTTSDAGRAFTTLEALTGQIYLVTVVAMIVANLGRPRGSARQELEGRG